MKKSIGVFLAVTLFCLSIAGCSAPGQGESSTPSAPSSQSKPASQSSALAGSSSQESSSASSGSTTSSSVSSESSYLDWNRGYYPCVTKELSQYYEDHPEFKTYFKTYLEPLSFLEGMQWQSQNGFTEKQLNQIANWSIHMLPDDVTQALPEIGLHADYPGDEVEKIAQQYFGVSPEMLQTAGNYQPETHTYYSFGIGFGIRFVMVITDARTHEDELILTFSYLLEHNFPVYTESWDIDEEGVYEMHIRLREDGTFQWLSCVKTKTIALEEKET